MNVLSGGLEVPRGVWKSFLEVSEEIGCIFRKISVIKNRVRSRIINLVSEDQLYDYL
jgi:hypothetical protein